MKRRKLFVLVMAALVAGFLFSGCAPAGLAPDVGIAVEGTWFIDWGGTYDETWVISDSEITYTSGTAQVYTADIVSYDNNAFNASETGEGNYGYAVIQYTAVDGAGTGAVGGYNIFRWQNYTGSACDFTQGYKNVGGDWPDNENDMADTAAEAINDFTAANSYFGGYSKNASLQ